MVFGLATQMSKVGYRTDALAALPGNFFRSLPNHLNHLPMTIFQYHAAYLITTPLSFHTQATANTLTIIIV